MTPLVELLAHSMGRGRATKSVSQGYYRICKELGWEIRVLTEAGFGEIKLVGGEDLAVAVTNVRDGEVEIVAGYDGQYGIVHPAI